MVNKDVWLYYHYGPMDCGKSTHLLQAAYNYRVKGNDVILAKPKIDDKGNDMIVSRLGENLGQKVDVLIDRDDDVVELLGPLVAKNTLMAVFIDEAQFLQPQQVKDLRYGIVRDYQTPVLTYGLLKDFRNEYFPGSYALWREADVKREIISMCFCGVNKATVNVRKDDGAYVFEGEQIAIEKGRTSYETWCEDDFETLRSAISSSEIPADSSYDDVYELFLTKGVRLGRSALSEVSTAVTS